MMDLRSSAETLIYSSDEVLEASRCCKNLLVVFVKQSSDQEIET
jgi:hypothetical protein